jgi:hypothetical protein
MGSGSRRKFIERRRRLPAANKRATLLRNVNLFLFVYVTQEVNQATNKGHGCEPECDPSGTMTSGRIRESHKLIEIIDRTDRSNYANQYRKNVFQAFHFEPSDQRMNYEGYGKSRVFLTKYGSMLTPGMRECKSEIC